jgi:hypothetical protein
VAVGQPDRAACAGRAQGRGEQPKRCRGPEEHGLRPVLLDEVGSPAAHGWEGEQHRGVLADDAELLLRVERGAPRNVEA